MLCYKQSHSMHNIGFSLLYQNGEVCFLFACISFSLLLPHNILVFLMPTLLSPKKAVIVLGAPKEVTQNAHGNAYTQLSEHITFQCKHRFKFPFSCTTWNTWDFYGFAPGFIQGPHLIFNSTYTSKPLEVEGLYSNKTLLWIWDTDIRNVVSNVLPAWVIPWIILAEQ